MVSQRVIASAVTLTVLVGAASLVYIWQRAAVPLQTAVREDFVAIPSLALTATTTPTICFVGARRADSVLRSGCRTTRFAPARHPPQRCDAFYYVHLKTQSHTIDSMVSRSTYPTAPFIMGMFESPAPDRDAYSYRLKGPHWSRLHPLWTYTYRHDSTLPRQQPYTGAVIWNNPTWSPQPKREGHFMMHAVSNIYARRRIVLLRKLIAALPAPLRTHVHGYGKFMGDHRNRTLSGLNSLTPIARSYKFVFAFENSACFDYITEKYWRAIGAESIPVVFGGHTNYSRVLPLNNGQPTALLLSDFDYNMTALVEHMLYLDSNETAYNAYLLWRRLPPSQLNPLFVELMQQKEGSLDHACRILQGHSPLPVPVVDVERWWNSGVTEDQPACVPMKAPAPNIA